MKSLRIFAVLALLGAMPVLHAGSILPEITAENYLAKKNWKGVTGYKIENGTLIIERTQEDKGAGAFFTRPFAVTAGAPYQVSAELEAAMAPSGRYNILIDWMDNSGKYVKREMLFRDKKSTGGKFLKKSASITAPAGAVKADFGVVVHNCGTVKFRSLSMVDKSVKTAGVGNMLPEFTQEHWNPAKGWSGHTDYELKEGVFTVKRTKDDKGAGAYFSKSFKVKEGESYDVAADMWVTEHKDGRYNVLIDWYDAKGKRLKERKVLFYLSSAGKDFTPYKATIAAPKGAVTAQMGLVINRTGTAKFRNLFFGEAKKKISSSGVKAKLPPPSSPHNLFPDPDFRVVENNWPKYWIRQTNWQNSELFKFTCNDKTLTISGGSKGKSGGIASLPMKIQPGRYYHISAQLQNSNVTGHSALQLRFLDAEGRKLSTISAISQWRGEQTFYRQHNIIQAPAKAAYAEVILTLHGTGTASFRDFKLNGTPADDKDDTQTASLLLNGSFEGADFAPEFIDCWRTVSGKAGRSPEASHGFHAVSLDAKTKLAYGVSDKAPVNVTGYPVLHGALSVKGGNATVKITFVDGKGKTVAVENIPVKGQADRYQENIFTVKRPANACFAHFAIENGQAPVLVDSAYLGPKKFNTNLLPPPVPRVADTPKVAVPIPMSEIKDFQGVPTWHIDGQPVVNSMYTLRNIRPGQSKNSLDYHLKVIETGRFPLYVVGSRINIDNAGPDSIEEALEQVDFQIRLARSIVPDARFLIWAQQYPSQTFAAEYPGELAKVQDPDCGFTKKIPGYSYGSELWGRLCARSLEKFLTELFKRPYGKNIVGIMPGFGSYGENNFGHISGKYYLSPHDFSEVMTDFFRKWLMYDYKGDAAAFAREWNRKNFNISHARVPTMLQRVPRLAGGFLDPAQQRQVIDYARCDSYSILHRVNQQCRAVKKFTDNRIFTASEIGYLTERHLHREMSKILSQPYLDAFGPAPGYTNRGPGDDIPDNAPVASLQHWKKIWLYQADVRSHLTGDTKKRFGDTANADESAAVYIRDMGRYLTKGTVPYHWTFGQWYNDPKIYEAVKEFNPIMKLSSRFPRQSTAEVAVVLDDLSLSCGIEFNYRRRPASAPDSFYFNRSLEWHRLGTPYDLWLLNDLLDSPKLKQYKAVVLPAQVTLSTQQRKLITGRLARDGRTLIWMYAPGVFSASGSHLNYSAANSGITGFKLTEEKGLRKLNIKLLPEALKAWGMPENYGEAGYFRSTIYGGFFCFNARKHSPKGPETLPARFAVTPGKDVEIWGHYADGKSIAAARRKFPEYTSVFWGSTALDNGVLRGILRQAGVHLYTDKPAVVYANSNFVMVHSREAGSYHLTLPAKAETVTDIVSGKSLAGNSDKVTLEMGKNATALLYFGKEKALQKAQNEVKKELAQEFEQNEKLRPAHAFAAVQDNQAKPADPAKIYPTDNAGFIRHWNFIGPFPNYRGQAGFDADFLNGEAAAATDPSLKFTAEFDAADPDSKLERNFWFKGEKKKQTIELVWRPLELSRGFVRSMDNQITMPFRDFIVYYLACNVISPDDRTAVIAVGADDSEKTWVNGELATQYNVKARSLNADTETHTVKLRKGSNRLLLKVVQGTGGFGHAVRFLAPATGKPMTDLKIGLK